MTWQLCCHGMCKSLSQYYAQEWNCSKAKFLLHLNSDGKLFSEMVLRTRWLTFCRQHYQIQFRGKRNFVYKFTEVCSKGSDWQSGNIGSSDDLASNRQQAITWTNDDQVCQCMRASPGLNEIQDRESGLHISRGLGQVKLAMGLVDFGNVSYWSCISMG